MRLEWVGRLLRRPLPFPAAPDGQAKAEAELLALLRSAEPRPGLQVQLTRRRYGWTIATTRLDGSASSIGRGPSFSDAWRHAMSRG